MSTHYATGLDSSLILDSHRSSQAASSWADSGDRGPSDTQKSFALDKNFELSLCFSPSAIRLYGSVQNQMFL